MRTVRNTVDTGRIVVCTIHQPSIDIFEGFDEVRYISNSLQVVNIAKFEIVIRHPQTNMKAYMRPHVMEGKIFFTRNPNH